ncbi:MAG: hypothetical protein QG650_776 [Patescibacteria group bacterium]|nr:hypothetical protein [Patescibacteria group bacterium]
MTKKEYAIDVSIYEEPLILKAVSDYEEHFRNEPTVRMEYGSGILSIASDVGNSDGTFREFMNYLISLHV